MGLGRASCIRVQKVHFHCGETIFFLCTFLPTFSYTSSTFNIKWIVHFCIHPGQTTKQQDIIWPPQWRAKYEGMVANKQFEVSRFTGGRDIHWCAWVKILNTSFIYIYFFFARLCVKHSTSVCFSNCNSSFLFFIFPGLAPKPTGSPTGEESLNHVYITIIIIIMTAMN